MTLKATTASKHGIVGVPHKDTRLVAARNDGYGPSQAVGHLIESRYLGQSASQIKERTDRLRTFAGLVERSRSIQDGGGVAGVSLEQLAFFGQEAAALGVECANPSKVMDRRSHIDDQSGASVIVGFLFEHLDGDSVSVDLVETDVLDAKSVLPGQADCQHELRSPNSHSGPMGNDPKRFVDVTDRR